MPTDISILAGGVELFDRVGPLWNQLRADHAAKNDRWASQLLSVPFETRRASLIEKAVGGVRIFLAVGAGVDVGYCVCTLRASREGEVDSLFVADSHRNARVGQQLMSAALAWFDAQQIETITLEVLVGNEAAIPFYERLGFAPRTTRMMRVR